MTTTDARKRLDESIDRLERTRTHSIDPDTGEFTRLDQETDMPTSTITVRLNPELVALLTEIRDRLPERESRITCMDCGIDLNPGDPLDCAKHAPADLEWLAEPAPVPHPDEALAKVLHDADSNGHFSWEGTGLETRADYLRMARAARQYIDAERDEHRALLDRADYIEREGGQS